MDKVLITFLMCGHYLQWQTLNASDNKMGTEKHRQCIFSTIANTSFLTYTWI